MENQTSPIEVAIVILNFNGVQHLMEFLPKLSLLNQSPFQLIIIDNASTDDSVKYITDNFSEILLLQLDKNYGFTGGYNRGLKKVNAKYYFILNNDIEITRKSVEHLHKFLKGHPEYAAVQPKIKAIDNPHYFEYAGASGGYIDILGYPFCRGRVFDTIEKDSGQYDDEVDIFWATGAAMLIKANIFHALNGFEEYFFAHQEEIDLCWRIGRAGYKIKVLPTSIAYHKGGGTLDYTHPFKTYLNFRNNFLMIYRNNDFLRLLWILPLRGVLDFVAATSFLFQGKFTQFSAIVKAHYGFWRHFHSHKRSKKKATQEVLQLKGERKENITGIIRKSLIFQYYLLRKKTFEEITK